ncbi:bifunctional lysylphosphatidylglycerol flippase/synthetase MprF [Pseudalkalibacillus caeni]|nr:bifunctional lysylphosphatidylglycerol flippase/synthetase MprF [Pseudalkalibacillus caeni]
MIRIFKIVFPILLLLVIYMEGKKEIHTLRAGDLLLHIKSMMPSQIAGMLSIGIFAIGSMVLYDLLIIRYLNLPIPFAKQVKFGWISNTFNNVIGFGGFAGASLRGLFYKRYEKDLSRLISVIVWTTPLMLTGLSLLAWLPVTGIVSIKPLLETHSWLFFALSAIALYLPGYLIISRLSLAKKGVSLSKNDIILVVGMIGASLIEWLFASLTLFSVSYILKIPISYEHLLALFIAAAVAGAISLIPGGVGSFDLIMLIGFQLYGISSENALLVLIFYRLFYYIIPWIIGLVLASTEFVSQTKKIMFTTFAKTKKSLLWWESISVFPKSILYNVSHWALAALIFLSGLLLLLSAATPGILERLKVAENLLSSPLMNLSHQLSVTSGIILLILARSILHRVKPAYKLTFAVLIAGAVFTFSKGFDYEEALFLLFIAMLLKLSQHRFYRVSYPITVTSMFVEILLLIIVLTLYILVGFLNEPFLTLKVPAEIRDLFVLQPKELLISSLIGLVLAILLIIISYGFYKQRTIFQGKTILDIKQVEAFLKNYNGNALTHLIFLKDKQAFWNKTGHVLMMYRKMGDSLVVLGDPIGEPGEFRSAIEEFQLFADQYGLASVFYQIDKNNLSLYHETGYDFFKLGEEAYVDLNVFSLSGKKNASLRAVKNKFEREGFQFEMVSPPFSTSLLEELEHVSTEWLGGKKEKGFSLGFFDRDYIQLTPLAVLRDSEGQLKAFATIMPVYDNGESLSIDLMRHTSDTPNGTMDMLFLSILQHARDKGYRWFYLGMAPLSNVGQSRYSFVSEKIAALIYKHGNFVYQFKGIRKYKEKFRGRWEPKYLAYRNNLPMTMLQLSLLISKKRAKPGKEIVSPMQNGEK